MWAPKVVRYEEPFGRDSGDFGSESLGESKKYKNDGCDSDKSKKKRRS